MVIHPLYKKRSTQRLANDTQGERQQQQQHQQLIQIIFSFAFSGVLLLVLAYTAVGSVLFMTLEGDTDDGDMIESSVAASKPYPRHDVVSSELRLK